MSDNIFENLTEEEQKKLWIYMFFFFVKNKEKAKQLIKEAKEAAMPITEYLEHTAPLWLGKNCNDCGNENARN